MPVSRANARGHDALRFDSDDARQARQRVPGIGRSRLDERDRDVLPFGHRELCGNQFVHGVNEHKADDEDSRREADADDGGGRAEWMARDVAQHHPAGVAQMARNPRRFKQASPITRRRLGAHRLGGWNADGAADS